MIQQPLLGPPGLYGNDIPANAATVVAPGATTTITQVALPAREKPASYRVRVRYGYTAGAPAAAEANNWRLVYQATVLMTPMIAAAQLVVGNIFNVMEFIFTDAGLAGNLALQSVGAATAGVAYTADMELTRIS